MATPTVMLLMGLLSTTICWFVSLVGVDSQRSIIADTCDSGGDEELMTCTKDLMQSMSSIDRLTVENIRNYYGGYPPECHLDFCQPSTTNSTEKGNISWSQTTVGFRRYVRCPFAYDEDLFAYRDCLVNDNQTINWAPENIDTCPLPAFSTAIDKLYNVTTGLLECTEYNCSTLLTSLSSALLIPGYHPRDPILSQDHQRLMRMCLDLITRCGNYPGLSTATLWNASDLLLSQEFVNDWETDTGPRFLDYLYWIFPNWAQNATSDVSFIGENVWSFALTCSSGNKNVYFSYPLTGSDQVSAALNISDPENDELVGINTFLIQPSRLPDALTKDLYLNIVHHTTTGNPPTTHPASTTHTLQPENSTAFNGTTPATATNNSFTSVQVSLQRSPMTTTSDAWSTSSTNGTGSGENSFSTGPHTKVLTTGPVEMKFSMIGPLMFVQLKFGMSNNKGSLYGTGDTLYGYPVLQPFPMMDDDQMIPVDITLRDPSFAKLNFNKDSVVCARTVISAQSPSPYAVKAPVKPWTADCVTKRIKEDVNAILCRCHRPSFVAVFQHSAVHPAVPAVGVSITAKPQSDLSVFLGFPYVREIYITGEVFKAVSLLCLVLTVLSYAVLRQARKGTPTRILLNLCVSLIVLLIVLYVAEYEAGSRMGCRLLNVFRYYLVLVSLLWNAVEAHNMYKMLIKVFNADTSHFVLIAGIFAWGLPAIAVGVGFAVNVETFDGTYDKCIFKCALRPDTRLFGWIVPMAVIILHNLVVFAMVMKVVIRTHNNPSLPGQKSGKTNGGRLCGALTMLVLLGVPWMVSAFGVINAVENSAEDILQKAFSGILVIFVGLQGLFIFILHCARNKAIRDQLRLHLISAASKLRSSITSSSSSTGSNHRLGSFSSKTSSTNVSRINLQALSK